MLETWEQPKPEQLAGSQDVYDWLIGYLQCRCALGEAKYGTRLKAPNGREPLLDLIDELTDATVYAVQAYLEKQQLLEKIQELQGETH